MTNTLITVDKTGLSKSELSSLLKIPTLQIINSKDGIEALNILHKHQSNIHAILWALNTPSLDDFDTIKLIKEKQEYQHIPVIVFSKFADKKYILKAIECGAVEFIIKPYDEPTVRNKLLKIIGMMPEDSTEPFSESDIIAFNYSDMISRELKAASRGSYPFTMMLASVTSLHPDVKNQRNMNDMIELINKVIKARIRETDTTFHYGINNLIILMPFVGKNAAEIVEKKLMNIFKTHSMINDMNKGFNLVVSSVTYPEDGKIKDKLIEKLEINFKNSLNPF